MIERVLQSGSEQALTGILCEPAAPSSSCGDLAVIFWNAGLLHHVGPNRLYVQMARNLAKTGIASYRFDASGLGDSDSRSGGASEGPRAVTEVREVMSLLEQRKEYSRFILVGLCSGSDEAHRVSVKDERVVGVVHLDGYGEKTPGYLVRYFGGRAVSAEKWKRLAGLVGSKAKSLFSNVTGSRQGRSEGFAVFERDFPSPAEIRDDLRKLVSRNTRLLYIYTGGVQDYYCYAGQFDEMFKDVDLKGVARSEYYPEADHLYSSPGVRKKMIERVSKWIQEIAARS